MIKARCKSKHWKTHTKDIFFDELDLDVTYPVLCVQIGADNGIFLFIHSVEGRWFPSPYPAEIFTITSMSIPTDWELGLSQIGESYSIRRITFAEWAHDEAFYEKLIDGDPDSVGIYDENRNYILDYGDSALN